MANRHLNVRYGKIPSDNGTVREDQKASGVVSAALHCAVRLISRSAESSIFKPLVIRSSSQGNAKV